MDSTDTAAQEHERPTYWELIKRTPLRLCVYSLFLGPLVRMLLESHESAERWISQRIARAQMDACRETLEEARRELEASIAERRLKEDLPEVKFGNFLVRPETRAHDHQVRLLLWACPQETQDRVLAKADAEMERVMGAWSCGGDLISKIPDLPTAEEDAERCR